MPGLRRLLSYNLAGQFVSNVLPSTIGGDVLRVSRLSKDTGETPKTFASVVLERLTGWIVLPLISVAGFVVNPPLQHLGRATQVAVGLAFVTLLALCIVLAAVADHRIGGRFDAREGWRRFAGAVHLGLSRLRREPAAAANVLLVGFAYQLALVLAAVAAAQALGVRPAGLTALLAFFPAVAIAQVLPDRDLRAGRAGGRLRALPRTARGGGPGGHRPRAAPLPPQPGREPPRRAGLRPRWARARARSRWPDTTC